MHTNTIFVVPHISTLMASWHLTKMYNTWLSDFRSDGQPRTKEVLFNHEHAKLRIAIEHAFGGLKAGSRY